MDSDERSGFDVQAEQIARSFHAVYERYAPDHISARPSRVVWEELPAENRTLMIAVVKKLLIDDVIEVGKAVVHG